MNDKTQTVTIRGEQFQIRELPWQKTLSVVKKIAASFLGVLDAKGEFVFSEERIVQAITEQEAVILELVQAVTNKPVEWIESLSPREILPLLNIVVEMNIDAELVATVKTAGKKLVDAFFIKKEAA